MTATFNLSPSCCLSHFCLLLLFTAAHCTSFVGAHHLTDRSSLSSFRSLLLHKVIAAHPSPSLMFCFSYPLPSRHPSSRHVPPVSNFTAGPLPLVIISTFLPRPMSLPLFLRNNDWNGRSLHTLWSFTPRSLFLSLVWWCSHLLIIPCYPQRGVRSCNFSHLDMFHGCLVGACESRRVWCVHTESKQQGVRLCPWPYCW